MQNTGTGKRPCLPPEEMTIHMLIGEISKITKDAVRKKSEAEGIPQGFRHIIFHLAHNDGISQLELARLTHLTPPTVSVALQKMESEGLVARNADSGDLRKTNVSLTDKGRNVFDGIVQIFRDHEKAITESLTDQEAVTLKELLLKVRLGILSESEEKTKQ